MGAFDTNLLEDALDVVGRQAMTYYPYSTRSKNSAGIMNATYSAGQAVEGSIQPVPRQMYEKLNLDWSKYYATIFVSKNVIDIARDVSGDQFAYAGRRYQAESRTDWFAQDGWDAILCIQIPATTPPFVPPVEA